MGNNYGLNDNYSYYEYVFDSSDTYGPAVASSSKTDWPLFVFSRPIQDIAALKVLEVQIPFSWYVFNDQINTFQLLEDGIGPFTVTIPPGNYNINSLMAQLKIALENVSLNTWTIVYRGSSSTTVETGKLTFTSSSVSALPFTFRFTNLDLPYFLGMAEGDNVSTAGPTPTLVAPGVANVSGPNYLYINSNRFGNSVQFYLPQSPQTSGNLGPEIAKIPVNTNPGGTIFWSDPDTEKYFDVGGLANLDQLDLYLGLGKSVAEDPLKLNGQPFSVKIGILVQKRTHNEFVGANNNNNRVERRNTGNATSNYQSNANDTKRRGGILYK